MSPPIFILNNNLGYIWGEMEGFSEVNGEFWGSGAGSVYFGCLSASGMEAT